MNVPRIPEFSCDRLYQQAIEDDQAKQYLPDPSADGKRKYLASSSSTVSATHAFVANFSLVIGTISPDYFITAIQDCYKKRKVQHDLQTEQYIKISTEMMNLVGASSRTSKGKPS